jgi:hypothetical protein
MAKGTAFCNYVLDLFYNGVSYPNVAINATASPITTVGLGLYTSTPGAGGNQTTNQASYTGYARLGISRVAYAGWTAAAAGAITNAALIQFGQSSTAEALTYVATGQSDVTLTAGVLWHFGALNATLNVDNLIVPQFLASQLQITES